MATNCFDLIKDGFFLPFTGSNRRVNYDILQMISNKVSLTNLVLYKDQISEWIEEYVDNCPVNLIDDEDNISESDSKSYAHAKVRYLVKCGWLDEDIDGLQVTYQLNNYGIRLLKTLNDIVVEDDTPIEFSGYVYNIYSGLCDTNSDHAVAIVEQIYKSSLDLNATLLGLNVSIKNFLTKLIRNNEATPKEILKILLHDYQNKVILKAFKNFREKDNPAKFKLAISSRIDDWLSSDRMNRNIENYIFTKCDNIINPENIKQGLDFFKTRLLYVKDQFEEIEDSIYQLNEKNTKYITTTRTRLNFLLNEETDIEGKVNDVLKGIVKIENDDFYENSALTLFATGNIDEKSLFTPRQMQRRQVVADDELIDEVLSDLELNNLKQELFKDNKFSVYNINEFVLSNLKSSKQVHAKAFKITEFDDIVKLFLAQLYSQNENVDYRIINTQEIFKAIGYKLTDFIIERK